MYKEENEEARTNQSFGDHLCEDKSQAIVNWFISCAHNKNIPIENNNCFIWTGDDETIVFCFKMIDNYYRINRKSVNKLWLWKTLECAYKNYQ